MDNFKLFVDMDGTLAVWRSETPFEKLFEQGYYRNLPPQQEVVDAVKLMQSFGVEVFALSAFLPDSQYAWREKHEWLDQHAPFIPRENRLLCPQNIPKSEYASRTLAPIDKSCILLDDYSKNLHEWEAAGGTGVKLMNGLNGNNGTWMGPAVSRFDGANIITDGVFGVWHKLCKEMH